MNNMHTNFSISISVLIVILLWVTVESALHHFPPAYKTDNFNYDVETPNTHTKDAEVSLNFRLPNETYPMHYDIKLTTNVHSGAIPFQGEVVIDIVVLKATSNIVLHARQLQISKVSITNPTTGEKEELLYEYETIREFLTLSRNDEKQFEAGSNWELTIIYNGKLRNGNKGFYITKFTDENGNVRYLAATQFESIDARHAFPCYDEPDKRANFTITIIHSPTYKAISNMPVDAALSSSGKTKFLTTARIPAYIVAFIVSDFEYTEGTLNSSPQHIYSRGAAKHAQEWALISSMLITQRLSKYYGVDFMLPKMDHVALPNFAAGGMENWGLATYREELLLYDEHKSTVFNQIEIANILAHEIAHQWFGDFVTIKWWTYLWLKEGFATLFSYRALADAYPEWDVWQEFHVNDYHKALTNDGGNNPRPMTHYVQTPNEISVIYDTVSYSKAGSVLYMWSNALTDKVFQRALHNYLTINQYTAAEEEQLFTAIQIAAKEENYKIPAKITEMMSSWSHQGGYPLLTVIRNYEDGTFTVQQEAFHNNETFHDAKTWYVPINYVVASKPDFRDTAATHYLLNVTEMKVNAEVAKNDWLVLNKQSAYYYRIKYDIENYKLIIDSLIEHPFKFHVRNRAQLMDDAFTFSIISKRLDHSFLLDMMTYLVKEDQYAPWYTARYIIKTLHRYLRDDQNYDDLTFFISDIIGPIYEKLGINDVPGEQHHHKYTRTLVIELACLAGFESCLLETNNKLKSLIEDNIPIEPNLQTEIYCNGLRQSSDEVFEYFYTQLMDSSDKTFRYLLISSLSCSLNKSQIKKLIYSSIDLTNKLRIEERYDILRYVYSKSGMGLLACIEFLNENWNEYDEMESDNNLTFDILRMASYVLDKSQEEKYLALVAQLRDSERVTPSFEMAVKDQISKNFEWLNNNRQPLMTWLAQYHADRLGGSSASLTASAILIAFSLVISAMRLF